MLKGILYAFFIACFFSCGKNNDATTNPPSALPNDQKILYNSGDSTYLYDITNKKLVWAKFLKPANIYIDSTKIFTTGASYLYCYGFNGSSGALWTSYTGALGYYPGASVVWPVGNDSLVYVSGDFSASVFAIYKNSGTVKWKTDLKLPTGPTPSRTIDPVLVNDKIIISGYHKLFSLQAQTGNIVWSYTTDNSTTGESLADCVAEGKIYHMENPGTVYCLDMNGALIWKQKISSFSYYDKDNITIKNGVLYLFASLGQVAVNATTGTILWQKSYKTMFGSYDICYAQGKIYSSYGRILVASATTGDSLAVITAGNYPVTQRSYNFLSSTSDKLISEMLISGSLAKDTLFIFNISDLSVYDKIILPGKTMTFPPVIFENGKILYNTKSGNEN